MLQVPLAGSVQGCADILDIESLSRSPALEGPRRWSGETDHVVRFIYISDVQSRGLPGVEDHHIGLRPVGPVFDLSRLEDKRRAVARRRFACFWVL